MSSKTEKSKENEKRPGESRALLSGCGKTGTDFNQPCRNTGKAADRRKPSLIKVAIYELCRRTYHPPCSALHFWMYPKKVDKCVRIRDKKKQKGKTHMSNKNSPTKYSEEFKKTIVTLYQSGKTYAEIKKEYGISSSALSNWVRKYSQVQVDEDTVLTAQQIKALQRRNAELEEENLILKKAIAIFTPHSDRD